MRGRRPGIEKSSITSSDGASIGPVPLANLLLEISFMLSHWVDIETVLKQGIDKRCYRAGLHKYNQRADETQHNYNGKQPISFSNL
jgi:hypothetical protein